MFSTHSNWMVAPLPITNWADAHHLQCAQSTLPGNIQVHSCFNQQKLTHHTNYIFALTSGGTFANIQLNNTFLFETLIHQYISNYFHFHLQIIIHPSFTSAFPPKVYRLDGTDRARHTLDRWPVSGLTLKTDNHSHSIVTYGQLRVTN